MIAGILADSELIESAVMVLLELRPAHPYLSFVDLEKMFRILFILFIAIPIIEIAPLIQVSEVIGGFATIAWLGHGHFGR